MFRNVIADCPAKGSFLYIYFIDVYCREEAKDSTQCWLPWVYLQFLAF